MRYRVRWELRVTGPMPWLRLRVPFSMQAQYVSSGTDRYGLMSTYLQVLRQDIYKGTITVTRFEKVIETIGIEVEVYDFSLPEETHLITYFNISKGEMTRFYWPNRLRHLEIEQLTMKYFDFLFAHRMETWINNPLVPELSVRG